jgi:branched-chain amino acid transport system permease protein
VSDFLQALINGFALGGLYALIALGVALVFGLLGLVNFAHGELLLIGGYTAYVVGASSIVLTLAAVVVVVGLAAVLMERLAFRPVRDADPTTLLVTSFALSTSCRASCSSSTARGLSRSTSRARSTRR